MRKLIPGVIYTVVSTFRESPLLFKADQSGDLHAHVSGDPSQVGIDLNNTGWNDNHWLTNGCNYRFLRVCDNLRGDISDSEAYKIYKLARKVQRRAVAKAGGLLKYKKQEWEK